MLSIAVPRPSQRTELGNICMHLPLPIPLSTSISLFIEHHECGREKTHTITTKDIHFPGGYEYVTLHGKGELYLQVELRRLIADLKIQKLFRIIWMGPM